MKTQNPFNKYYSFENSKLFPNLNGNNFRIKFGKTSNDDFFILEYYSDGEKKMIKGIGIFANIQEELTLVMSFDNFANKFFVEHNDDFSKITLSSNNQIFELNLIE
jgi:hypothetical protein